MPLTPCRMPEAIRIISTATRSSTGVNKASVCVCECCTVLCHAALCYVMLRCAGLPCCTTLTAFAVLSLHSSVIIFVF